MATEIERKAENAMISWLGATAHGSTITLPIRNSDEDDEQEASRIVVEGSGARERIVDSGVYELTLSVHYHSQADDENASAHVTNAAKILDALNWDELAAKLSDSSNFKCHAVLRDQAFTHSYDGRTRIKSYPLTLICQSADS